jgi:polyvinyl alcohol dehydrogenase (cytochrome)
VTSGAPCVWKAGRAPRHDLGRRRVRWTRRMGRTPQTDRARTGVTVHQQPIRRTPWVRRRTVAGIGLALLVLLAGCTSSRPAASSTPPTRGATPVSPATSAPASSAGPSAGAPTATPQTWTGYHADAARTGAVTASTTFGNARIAWSDDLGGAVRGQVLAFGGRIVAATENNRVVALDPRTGDVVWSVALGRPLTDVASVAGCGDVDPLGVTSTPVVDPRTGTVYVVGEVSDGHGGVSHRLEGLSVATGAVRLSETVDPPLPSGEHPTQLLQRAGLALANGRVYIAYGGNDGDCGTYNGWVVGVDETGPAHQVSFRVASDGHGGAIWESGGAPALDAAGHVYVTTGNANPDPPQGGPDPKKYTESVVELSPDLKPLASYKDHVAGGDEDLATGNPVLLSDDQLFAVGKTDIGFVLRRSDLSLVASVPGVCGSDPDGGPAYDAATNRVFVPCRSGGIQVVDIGARTLGPRLSGADSAPILIGNRLWAIDHDAGTLAEFDTATGHRLQNIRVAPSLPIFNSPSTALGLLLVPTGTGVTALR